VVLLDRPLRLRHFSPQAQMLTRLPVRQFCVSMTISFRVEEIQCAPASAVAVRPEAVN
jgi:hypothetical protein